jgi:hypothetical protein
MQALAQTRDISEPYYRAQALSWVARFTNEDPVSVASEAARAAKECEDNYKKSAVRAREIAALAERDCTPEAQKRLNEALSLAKSIGPISSRSEAMLLLLQAAFRIDKNAAEKVYGILRASCPIEEHWRCKRAVRDGEKMISGELRPRPFFW